MVRQGWLNRDLTEGMEVDTGYTGVKPWLRQGQINAYLNACTEGHRIRSTFVMHTGLRASEAVHARWDWLEEGPGRPVLRVPARDPKTSFASKGRRARAIPLSEEAQAALQNAKKKWGETGFLLHAGKKPIRSDNWNRDTAKACKKAKLMRVDSEGRSRTLVDFHGLRRTARGALDS